MALTHAERGRRATGYDRLAPVYAGLERLAFGNALQHARLAHLGALRDAAHVLTVGEGDGRFVAALARHAPGARILATDASPEMLRVGRDRAPRSPRVAFEVLDLRTWRPPLEAFDGVVAHFVLDQFEPEAQSAIAQRLVCALRPGGTLLVADFVVPAGGWRAARARIWLRALYAFFEVAAGVRARRLAPIRPLLESLGMEVVARSVRQHGMLESVCYRKPAARTRR